MLGKAGLLCLVAATAAIRGARADFMVYTEPPIPISAVPSFANPGDAKAWTASVVSKAYFAFQGYGGYTDKLGAPYKSSSLSAGAEIAAFFKTASNYTVAPGVTETGSTTTFFSKPPWYTALPGGARAFKEGQVSAQFSIVRSIIAQGTSKGAAAPTAVAWDPAKFGIMAAAAAAAFL